MLLLGIDGGQTSTKASICDTETGRIEMDKGPPIDHMYTSAGREIARKGIQITLNSLLAHFNGDKMIDAAVISISGVREEYEVLLKSWVSECLGVRSFKIVSDVIANLAGASAGKNDGILVIAGGGSIAYFAQHSKEYVSGGYGHILGDDGSAYWIGLHALQAAIRSGDGRGPDTVLHERILSKFGLGSYWDIKRMIHSDRIGRGDIANLTMIVDDAAAQDDLVSRDILNEAGLSLGKLANSVIRQIEEDGITTVRKIYPTGGVFRNRVRIKSVFVEAIRSVYPDYTVHDPAYSPLAGTLILAAEMLNIELSPIILSVMEEKT